MADGTLATRTAASALDGNELYYTVQGGNDRKATGLQIKTLVNASPTITGHATIEGVTATGATGTGKFVFDTAPTFQTSIKLGGATFQQPSAGTFNFNLPAAAGSAGDVLTSGGGGANPMTWATPIAMNALTDTFNNAGTVFKSIQLTVADTNHAAGSRLLSLVDNSTEVFGVDPDGQISTNSNIAGSLGINYNAAFVVGGGGGQTWIAPILAFASGGDHDTTVVRDAAFSIHQRSGTNAQKFSVANTYTSGTSFETGVFDWITTSNVLRIGTDKGSGGGSARAVDFIIGGTKVGGLAATGATLSLGVQQTSQGQLVLSNTAAGSFATTIQSSNSATAAVTYTLPTAVAGAAGYVLTDAAGDGVLSWAAGGGGVTIGTTAITSGTTTRLLYDLAGKVQEAAGVTVDPTSNGLVLVAPATAAASLLTLTGQTGVLAASQPVLNMTQTWNAAGVAFTGIKFVVTATAQAAGSSYFNILEGSTAKVSFVKESTYGGGALKIDMITGQAGDLIIAQATVKVWNGTTGSLVAYPFQFNTSATPPAFALSSTAVIGWCSSTASNGTIDTWIIRGGAGATIQHGAADAAAPVAQILKVQSVIAGTASAAGTDWTFIGSKGTGTTAGAGGKIIFQTAPVNSSTGATAQNPAVTALTLTAPALGGDGGTVTQNPSVVVGSLAALALTDTDGFLYIPTCAGTPSGTPTAFTGKVAIVYDTTANKFWVYNGGWKGGTAPGVWS